MPTGPLIGVNLIVGTVLARNPDRILDLGMGTGKWGFLLREQTDFAEGRMTRDEWRLTIDGVEAYEPYVGDHQHAVYNEIFLRDVRSFLQSYDGERYDVALALDIIEHFQPHEAVEFIGEVLDATRMCIISTPKGFYAQEGHANELEAHRSWWPPSALRKLAAICSAELSIAQIRMTNIAVLARGSDPPKLRPGRLLEATAFFKDHLVPQGPYYRLIHRSGPSILDQQA